MLLPPDAAGVIIMQMPTAMAFVIMQVQAAPIMRMLMGMEYAIIMEPHKAGILWMPMEMGFAIIIPMAYVLEMAWDKGAASAADATDGTDKIIMRSEQEVNRAVEQYSDMVQRLCMIHLKNRADTEDIFQTVFLKYVLSSVSFESREHEKAWFIRVTINACKDLLKKFFRSHTVSLDEIMEQPAELPPDNRHVLEAVLSLPAKYKEVVYLHYYEDYTAPQISHILGKNVNTIYTLLTRSRQMLKEKLGGDEL